MIILTLTTQVSYQYFCFAVENRKKSDLTDKENSLKLDGIAIHSFIERIIVEDQEISCKNETQIATSEYFL